MFRMALLLMIPALAAGCATARSFSSKTPDDITDIGVCLPKSQLAAKIGGVDETIAIPGGGIVEVHDVYVRNRNTNRNGASSAALTILTFGVLELTAGTGDAIMDCQSATNASGFNSKCDFKRLRYYFHYADEGAAQAACFEMKEVWAGTFSPIGDKSRCPSEYKTALAKVMDTSSFPNATHSWFGVSALTDEQRQTKAQLEAAAPYELLTIMAADNQANCSG